MTDPTDFPKCNDTLADEELKLLADALEQPDSHAPSDADEPRRMGPEAFHAMIDNARHHVQALKRGNHEAYGDRPRWPIRPPKPKKIAKTDAERSKTYRDTERAAKIAAAPVANRTELAAQAQSRRELLEQRLAARPLPPKLRHLHGREEELAWAWMAREVVAREPEYRDHRGAPRTISRVVEIFGSLFPMPTVAWPTDAMKRRLEVVAQLEALGVWPAASGTARDGEDDDP